MAGFSPSAYRSVQLLLRTALRLGFDGFNGSMNFSNPPWGWGVMIMIEHEGILYILNMIEDDIL